MESVYSPTWTGGTYSEETNKLLLLTKERYDIQDKFEHNPVIGISDLHNATESFLRDLKDNRIYTGLPSLDKNLILTKGMLFGVLGCPGSGKCLGKDTPIIMFNREIKKVQDIVNGDKLMGPDGTSRNVRGVTKGVGPLYKIIPEGEGLTWVCNDVHVLSLKRKDTGDIQNIPLNEFIALDLDKQKSYTMWRPDNDINKHSYDKEFNFFIESLGEGEYFGFELDGDHLFLLEDFTVTHNTSFLNVFAENTSKNHGPVLYFSMDMSKDLLGTKILQRYTGYSLEKLEDMILHKSYDKTYLDAVDKFSEDYKNVGFCFENGYDVGKISNIIS